METNRDRRDFLGASLAGAAVLAGVALTEQEAVAAPNGTRPTKLQNLSVTSVSTRDMRVSGQWMTVDNRPVVGYAVYVYSVFSASFTRWATLYTNSSGTFSGTMPKLPSGALIQIEAEGNGAYSRPYPTYPRV